MAEGDKRERFSISELCVKFQARKNMSSNFFILQMKK